MKTACLLTAFGLMAASPAFAETQPKPYIDNRSEAAELIRSFYNAIERRECNVCFGWKADVQNFSDIHSLGRSSSG